MANPIAIAQHDILMIIIAAIFILFASGLAVPLTTGVAPVIIA